MVQCDMNDIINVHMFVDACLCATIFRCIVQYIIHRYKGKGNIWLSCASLDISP